MTATVNPLVAGVAPARDVYGPVFIEAGLSLCDQAYLPAYSTSGGDTIRVFLDRGPMHWLRRWTMNGFRIYHQAGSSGDTATGLLARFDDDVINRDPKPDTCFIWIWGNDVNLVDSDGEVAEILLQTQNAITAIVDKARNAGINVLFGLLPANSTWQVREYRARTHFLLLQWARQMCADKHIRLLDFYTPSVRPAFQVKTTGVTLVRTSNTVVASHTSHGYSTGDFVFAFPAVNSTFNTVTPLAITVNSANEYQYTQAGADATTTATMFRTDTYADLMSDGTTHFFAKGGSKLALAVLQQFLTMFPGIDVLSGHEGDLTNMIGTGGGQTGGDGASNVYANNGMMQGTTGDRSGTAVAHTGNVARGWASNVMSGNPTSVVCTQVLDTDPGTNQQQFQRVDITAAGGADCEHELKVIMTKPSAWQAANNYAVGNWVIPTVANGYFYVATADAGSSAASEPTWPTVVGQTVTDSGITWECRLGWMTDDMLWAAARVDVLDMSSASAIECISLGIVHTSAGDNIMDGERENRTNAPLYQELPAVYCTPIAAVTSNSATLEFSVYVRVRAGATVSYQVGRASLYKEAA
jgi:hypothetical protein